MVTRQYCFLILCLFLCLKTAYSQITVSGGLTAVDVANVVNGGGLTIQNATINCPDNAYGTFNGASSNIGVPSGILLTTGNLTDAPGPNNNEAITQDNGTSYSDPDLVAIEPKATNDPCILEFDVIPTCNSLTLNYVFASDEYPEFVCSTFNDAFGFFITGPNPLGGNYNAQNIAIVPGTGNMQVAINSVNQYVQGTNTATQSSYASSGCTSTSNAQYYVPNYNGTTVQYDGFTVPLTATIAVTPCQSYHIKFAIADAGDGLYDSGVFLTENGFVCSGNQSTTTAVDANCGAADGSATVTVPGATPPLTYVWDAAANSQSTATATGLSAGDYMVTVTDAGGCQFIDTATVGNVNSNLTVAVNCTDATALGANDGQASATASGGPAPYTYAWSNGGNGASVTNLAPGTITVTVTDNTGCTATGNCIVNEPPFCTVSATTVPVLCFGQSTGSATANFSGGVAPITYSWSNGGSTQTIGNLAAGTYTVTVSDASPCTEIISVTVTQPASALAATSVPTNITCANACDGIIASSVNGGTSPYSYAWSSAQVTPGISNLCNAGTYTVTVTDANSCTATSSATITQPNPITFNTSSTPENCGANDGTAILSGLSGGPNPGTYTIQWDAATGNQTTNTANGLNAATYSVTITSGLCDTVASITVPENPPVSSNATSTNISCNGACDGTATLTPSGGSIPPTYQYSWNNGQSGATLSGLCAGTYTATVTEQTSGCSSVSSVTITEPAVLAVSLVQTDITCFGACNGAIATTVTGGTTNYTYSWSSGQTTSNLSSLCVAQAYSITVTDANLCTATASVTITEPSDITYSTLTTNDNCNKGQGTAFVTNVAGGPSTGYTYNWGTNPVQSSSSASGLTPGNYNVTITSGSCSTVTSVTVGNNPPPTASVTGTLTQCYGSCDATATVTAGGGISPYSYGYAWSNQQNTPTATALCATTHSVTVTDLTTGCTASASVTINQPTIVTLTTDPSPITTICPGGSAALTALAAGGTPPYTYDWDNGYVGAGPNTVTPTTPSCFSVTATDANGCASTAQTVCVDMYNPLSVSAFSDQSICPGTPINLGANATGGNGQFIYAWTDILGNVVGSGPNLSLTPAGNYPNSVKYVVSAYNDCHPPVTDTVTITFFQEPIASATPMNTMGCEPFTVTFYNTSNPGGTSCTWTVGDGTILTNCDSITHTFSQVGTFYINLSIVTADGCQSSLSPPIEVIIHPNPQADFSWSPEDASIDDMNIQFTDESVGPPNSWQWYFGDNDTPDTLSYSTQQNPSFDFTSDDPGQEYLFYLQDTGYYPVYLIVSTPYGCKDTVMNLIHFKGAYYFNIPNAFTPDGDGINDFFFPVGIGIEPYKKFKFEIFNRWGDMIFVSNALDDPWDGTARELGGADMCQEGVYVWKLEFEELEGTKIRGPFIGHVTLLKH